MNKDSRVYLAQILECIQRIEAFTSDGEASFYQDARTQDAVLHNLAVIGEAAKRVDTTFRAEHPNIPWRSMTGLRDVLIHQYDRVRLDLVWAAVENSLPSLREEISKILPPLDDLERELGGDESE
jgi:uncharacterized protein with HEPN domain